MSRFIEKAEDNFPFKDGDGNPSYRQGQEMALKKVAKAFEDGYKYVVLNAPTGSGKSAINTALARCFPKSIYTTPQNSLIDQITEDDVISDYHNAIKGRNNYPCKNHGCSPKLEDVDDDQRSISGEGFDKEKFNHNAASCTNKKKSVDQCTESGDFCCAAGAAAYFVQDQGYTVDRFLNEYDCCPYTEAVLKGMSYDKIALTNLHYYVLNPHLSKADLVVIDEAHNLEGQGFDFCEFIFSEYNVPFFEDIENDIPTEDPEKIHEYVTTEVKERVRSTLSVKEERLKMASSNEEKTRLSKEVATYQNLQGKIENVESVDPEHFVVEREWKSGGDLKKLVLKPVYVDEFFQKIFLSHGDRFLFSSATFNNAKMQLKYLGIPEDEVRVIDVPNFFPEENRKVRFVPKADMSGKSLSDSDFNDMASGIAEICRKHSGSSGIVHCKSYSKMQQIYNQLKYNDFGTIPQKILPQFKEDKEDVLDEYRQGGENYLLLSVAQEEGLDLKDDLARFNVVAKVPNMYAGDERIQKRLNDHNDWDWYFMNTAMDLTQSYGRTTRSRDDHSTTYILDSDFGKWVNESRRRDLFPDWFWDAFEKQRSIRQNP